MQVVYFNNVANSLETLKVHPETVEEAIGYANELFATGKCSFAQVLAEDGFVLENLVPQALKSPVSVPAPTTQPRFA